MRLARPRPRIQNQTSHKGPTAPHFNLSFLCSHLIIVSASLFLVYCLLLAARNLIGAPKVWNAALMRPKKSYINVPDPIFRQGEANRSGEETTTSYAYETRDKEWYCSVLTHYFQSHIPNCRVALP